KGYDPRDFALVASGGAGPLHVMAMARELHVPRVIIPLFPSHFSALGMLLADERHDFIRTLYSDLARLDFAALARVHGEMVAESERHLRQRRGATYQLQLDLRYVGQEFTLSVPVTIEQVRRADRQAIRAAFDALYEQRYAHHSPDEPVELVNVRLAAIGQRPRLSFPRLGSGKAPAPETRRPVWLGGREPVPCPIYRRPALPAGAAIAGPAIVQEHGTTTVLFAGDRCQVADTGELIVEVGGAE
ncbi:MAG: hydantoinase/oxoprolinase family protein, partial [Stellaceae bacterium]